jgi:hypothetical protein
MIAVSASRERGDLAAGHLDGRMSAPHASRVEAASGTKIHLRLKNSMNNLQQRGLAVKGNTFPIKNELKRIGCTWDQATRNWIARDYMTLQAAYKILGDFEAAAKLAKMSAQDLLKEAKKVARGAELELVRNRRQPPPIGALMQHPEHGMVLVIATGECFLDESEGPEAWKCKYRAIPVEDEVGSLVAA